MPHISTTLSDELMDKLNRLAKAEGVSASEMLVRLLAQGDNHLETSAIPQNSNSFAQGDNHLFPPETHSK